MPIGMTKCHVHLPSTYELYLCFFYEKICSHVFDDILIYSPSWTTHFTTKKTFIRKGQRRTLITKSPRKDAINMGFAFTQL